MARQLQERVEYGNGFVDEWGPYSGKVDTWGWTDADFRRFVREQNAAAKREGSWVRLRSVEDNDDLA